MKKTLNNYELGLRLGQIKLPQIEHLEKCIQETGADSVWLIEPFDRWQSYITGDSGQLALYAQQSWKHIDELVSVIEQQTCDWVFMAVNRYCLLANPDPAANQDWDQAILEYFQKHLKTYSVVDYKYQPLNHTGSVGNFIVPDNRLLCKKLK